MPPMPQDFSATNVTQLALYVMAEPLPTVYLVFLDNICTTINAIQVVHLLQQLLILMLVFVPIAILCVKHVLDQIQIIAHNVPPAQNYTSEFAIQPAHPQLILII